MTTPIAPSDRELQVEIEKRARYRQVIRYTSIGALVLCPVLLALPPRKFDAYTVVLLGGTAVGANQTYREFTGRTIVQAFNTRVNTFLARVEDEGGLPTEKAREIHKRLKEERQDMEMKRLGVVKGESGEALGNDGKIMEAVMKKQEEDKRGVLQKLWMGDEKDDWKAKRDAKEKEAIEEGKGYGSLISEQIWEVWNGGEKKMQEVKEEDEKVVKEKKQGNI